MKTKLLTLLFVATLCTAGLSSCSDETISPAEEAKKEKGAQGVEDGF